MQLVQRLIQKGLLTEGDLARIEEARALAGATPLHELLRERGVAKEEDVLPLLAEEFGLELADLTSVAVEPETLRSIPVGLVHRHNLMPLSRQNGTLTVATGDPFDVNSLDELQTLTGLQVLPVLASPREIVRLIKTHFGVGGETVTALVRDQAATDGVELLQETEA